MVIDFRDFCRLWKRWVLSWLEVISIVWSSDSGELSTCYDWSDSISLSSSEESERELFYVAKNDGDSKDPPSYYQLAEMNKKPGESPHLMLIYSFSQNAHSPHRCSLSVPFGRVAWLPSSAGKSIYAPNGNFQVCRPRSASPHQCAFGLYFEQ